MTRVLVAFGSNINPDRNVVEAVKALAARVRVVRISPVYENPPVGAPDAPPFINGIIEIDTDLDGDALRRDILRPIEAACGRVRSPDLNTPRPIDLDIILHGEEMVQDPASADHVAVPFADLFPDRIGFPLDRSAFRRRPNLESRLDAAVPNAGRPARPAV